MLDVSKDLAGKIAVVAGATRGAGRGIATALGEAGATVYCTGRSVPGKPGMANRPETIHETAEIVTARGGKGIPVQVDHTQPGQVARLFEQVGEFDILINDIWGGEDLVEWGKKLWETKLDDGLTLIDRAIKTHIITSYYGLHLLRLAVDTHAITSHFAIPLLLKTPGGLVVEVNDGTADYNGATYRNSFFYDLAKAAVLRMGFALGHELRPHGATAVSLTPGWLRSEAMLEAFGVTEANWRDAVANVKSFIASETPLFVGRGIAALAADPNAAAKNGRVYASWDLGDEYGVTDADGTRPHFVRWLRENEPEMAARWKKLDDAFYAYWGGMPYDMPG